MTTPATHKPWPGRKRAPFEKVDHEGCTIYYRREGRLITELCRGTRYAHVDAGILFNDEQYRGSYIDDWHGGPSGSLTDMVLWLTEEDEDEGFELWFTPKYVTLDLGMISYFCHNGKHEQCHSRGGCSGCDCHRLLPS